MSDRPHFSEVTLTSTMTKVGKMDPHVLAGINWNKNQKQIPRIPKGFPKII